MFGRWEVRALTALALCGLVLGCSQLANPILSPEALSSAKAITAFSFTNPAVTGTINEAAKTITVMVPYGTTVTSLVATFTTTGLWAAVGATTQVSGSTPNNFTNPVIYTVTAADSSTRAYTVTVSITTTSAKTITAFSFPSLAAIGTINETAKTIAVKVPYGTAVTALVSTFTTTGSRVTVGATTQVSGSTPNDFASPVIYTVIAADASTQAYTVTLSDVSDPSLFTYSVSNGEATITGLSTVWTQSTDPSKNALVIPSTISGYTVTSIGDRAFNLRMSLTSVTILSSVNSIGNEAFHSCTSLTSLTILPGVTSIGEQAFQNCVSLTSLTIPSSVTSIGSDAFHYCDRLASITIPSGVTSIGDRVFSDCVGLKSITIPSSITTLSRRTFYGCTSLASVMISFGVTSIADEVFYGCASLTSVTISSSVTDIGYNAFRDCTSLASVAIPLSVTNIGVYAFINCTGLQSVYVYAIIPPAAGISFPSPGPIFLGCTALESIYVPPASVDAYKAAWNIYADLIKPMP